MGDILEAADYPDVRYLIGADTTSVPDAVIEAEPNLDYIEQIVKDMADGWSSDHDFDWIKAQGDATAVKDWLYLRVGTMCLLAARLIAYLSMKMGSSFKVGGYSESGVMITWLDRVKDLIRRAAEAFSRISTRDWTRATIFIATGPTSSKEGVPAEWEEWFEMIMPRVVDYDEESGENDTYYSTSR